MIRLFQNCIIVTFLLCVNCLFSYDDLDDLAVNDLQQEFPNSTEAPLNNHTEDISISTTPLDYEQDLKISYTYAKNIFNLTIVSDNYRSYKKYTVEVRNLKWIYIIESRQKPTTQPKTSIEFSKLDPYTEYKFKIIAHLTNGKTVIKDIKVQLGGYVLDSIDCNSVDSQLLKIPNLKRMSMTIVVKSNNEKRCFQAYHFCLNKFINGKCSDSDTVVQKNVTYDKKTTVTFENLSYGNYCLLYEGIHEYCPNMKCIPSYETIHFVKDDHQDITPMPSIQVPSSVSLYFIPVISFAFVALVSTVVMVLLWKGVIHCRIMFYVLNKIKKPYEGKENALRKEVPVVDDKSPKELIVPILYAQDCKIQNKVTVAFYKFIKECFHVKPIIDVDDIGNINKGDVAWIENLVNYKCPNMEKSNKIKDNKRFIILETKCALKIYRSWQNQQNLYYKKYNHLNDLFIRGLSHLSSVQMRKIDYCHLFVVRFSYSPSDEIDIVPRTRFLLPDCLVELYNSIHKKQTDFTGQQKETLLQEWEKKDSFKNLKNAIKEMEEYVAKNPNYVDNLFLSDVNDLKEVYVI